MESVLRASLIAWLQADPALADGLNTITEEASLRASPPWLGIVASASTDWSVKDRQGREVRLAMELHCRGDDPATAAALGSAIEARVNALPANQPGFSVANCTFLRARAEQRPGNLRAVLIEYRFRLLAA
ncbi:MAG: hypothetical protein RLZZ08_56 [Pseudomonadota bacterium]|jgi:hypothetical protein